MSSTIFFFIFVPFLALVLLSINLIFAPHNPYQEKESAFECGFHSFLGQNRTQFSISFFIFALLFLLFDLEILLVYPYIVSAYANSVYGLFIMLMFFIALTVGLGFELGKKALNIDSRQVSSLDINRKEALKIGYASTEWGLKSSPKSHSLASLPSQSKISYLHAYLIFFLFWINNNPILFKFILFMINNLLLNYEHLDLSAINMVNLADSDLPDASPPDSSSTGGDASSSSSSDSGDGNASVSGDGNASPGEHGNASPGSVGTPPDHLVFGPEVDHTNHAATGGSCLDNPRHSTDDFPDGYRLGGRSAPLRGSDTEMDQNRISNYHHDCCRCGQDVHNSHPYECNQCCCVYHPDCVTDQEKSDYDVERKR